MNTMTESIQFHLKHAWFNFREMFSDWPMAMASNLLIPFFVWILSHLWQRFNAAQSELVGQEIVLYIAITEILFMTFVRGNSVSRASADFSISLARPRSWPISSFSGLVGRSLGARLFMLMFLLPFFPLMSVHFSETKIAILRFFSLLPWLAVIQGLFALFFANAQVLWYQTDYFLLPFGKIFLVLGGVWGPVSDFALPWKNILLQLPPSDLFFQPAYFCLRGQFYQMSSLEWFIRTAALVFFLSITNYFFFKVAKKRHQAYGG